jgi:FixJ family two-component response regulator
MIAVVDDDAQVRDALARVLRSAGYAVAQYESGLDFLESLTHGRPHCVVLDLRMPGLDGFGLQEALARGAHNIPVIVVSGDLTAENIARATKLGALCCLPKPVDADRLLAVVGKACSPVTDEEPGD